MSDDSNETTPTWIEVSYPAERGVIGLRGSHAPLSWEHTTPPTRRIGDHHLFSVPMKEGELVELKVVRGDDWAHGRNYVVHAGEHLRLEPSFEGGKSNFVRDVMVEYQGRSAKLDILLPPSYGEQPKKRYPVLYILDGQALWQHSQDPFGTWGMDGTLSFLWELGAIAELIVVGIHTSDYRFENLTAVPDAHYGGGNAAQFLETVVEGIYPYMNRNYRTQSERESTGILGSSLGGLFAFYAAWTRPDVFGKAACLSSSFWWANRWAVRHVQSSPPPIPRPVFYLDSGAAPQPMEEDVRLIDGFHHTRSMLRALTRAGFDVGFDLHRLVFPGQAHHTASWASRVALPLQLQFPVTLQPLDSVRWGTSFEENDLETVSSARPESAHFKAGSTKLPLFER